MALLTEILGFYLSHLVAIIDITAFQHKAKLHSSGVSVSVTLTVVGFLIKIRPGWSSIGILTTILEFQIAAGETILFYLKETTFNLG